MCGATILGARALSAGETNIVEALAASGGDDGEFGVAGRQSDPNPVILPDDILCRPGALPWPATCYENQSTPSPTNVTDVLAVLPKTSEVLSITSLAPPCSK